MRAIWGPVTEVRDLGVVAEQCPHCERVMPCLLRSVERGNYVFFLKSAGHTIERSCLCTACHKAFLCNPWCYATAVPPGEAKSLKVEDLLARTNPGLVERLQLKEQICALGGDASFAVAYEQLGGLRPSALRSKLLTQLLGWGRLAEAQRCALTQQIAAQARAWQFARQVAPGFPAHAGCLTIPLAALVVGTVFLLVPAVHDWLWGTVTVVAGFGAAALSAKLLLTQQVRQWTRKVLVQEAEDANVSLPCFLAVVDDVPGSRLGMMEELWPLKVELDTIRGVLIAEGKLSPAAPGATPASPAAPGPAS
jgi:hypothetical protein